MARCASLSGSGIIEKKKVIHRKDTSKIEIKRKNSPENLVQFENIIDGGRKKASRECKIFMKYIYGTESAELAEKGCMAGVK